jgi:hypothetical protein
MMMLVGIGWAKPVPIKPYNFRKTRKGIFLTSIAGVVTNFIIATICFIIIPFTFGAARERLVALFSWSCMSTLPKTRLISELCSYITNGNFSFDFVFEKWFSLKISL